MGKSIYFSDKELAYMWLVFSNIDATKTEEEGNVKDNIFDKVIRARGYGGIHIGQKD